MRLWESVRSHVAACVCESVFKLLCWLVHAYYSVTDCFSKSVRGRSLCLCVCVLVTELFLPLPLT